MLIKDPRFLVVDPIHAVISGGRGSSETEIDGVYEIGHFGASDFPGKGYTSWPGVPSFPGEPETKPLSIGCYGVSDSVQQILDKCPELQNDPDRKFVVTVTRVRKADQSPVGGWRWHKWGPYIGDKAPSTEYLYDEPEIDEVLVYHIYEKVS